MELKPAVAFLGTLPCPGYYKWDRNYYYDLTLQGPSFLKATRTSLFKPNTCESL